MSFESPYASRFLTPISSAICIPIKRALYSVTLLEHGSVNENAHLWEDKYYPHSCYDIYSRAHSWCAIEEELPHLFFERCLDHANFSDLVWKILIKFGSQPLDLDAQPGNLPLLVRSRLFVIKITFHIGIAVWPILPVDRLVMMASSWVTSKG